VNAGTKATARGEFAHLKTLEDVVDEFKRRYSADFHHDPIVNMCFDQKTIEGAIRVACAGKRPDGKTFSMDSMISRAARATIRSRLLDNIARLESCNDFEELHDLIESLAPKGVGPLLVYNLAQRIGARLGVKPTDFVYLHAGPLAGWRALTGGKTRFKRVAITGFPPALRVLPAHRIEDLLCEFSAFLHPGLLR
jgi:hypothetical protein